MRRIRTKGLFGGSFNPIHNGHIALGTYLLRHTDLDEIKYMLSPQNPLKSDTGELASDRQRYEMLEVALRDRPGLTPFDFELHMPKPSYTYLTLRRLRQLEPQTRWAMIIGADNWRTFDRWAHPEEILQNHIIYVYPRKGFDLGDIASHPHVIPIDAPLHDVSSTEIRQMCRQGEDISAFVPSPIVRCVVEVYGSR